MQRRLRREREARKQAETLLTHKSRELFDALVAARESEQRLQAALWASGEGIWEWHALDGLMQIRGLLVDHLERPPMSLSEEELLQRVLPEDREAAMLAWRLHLSGAHDDIDIAYRLRFADGVRWLRVRGRTLERDAAGRPMRVVGTIKDITVQRAAEESLHTMAQAFANTHDALVVVDAQWRIVETNQSWLHLLRLTQDAVLGTDLRQWLRLAELASVDAGSATVNDGLRHLDESLPAPRRGEATLEQGERIVPVEVTITEVGGQAACRIVAVRDISEQRHSQAQLEHLALNDPLTGLPNRLALQRHLDQRVARVGEAGFGLLFMDLDGFKSINDSLGHDQGDVLLVEVASRLREALPDAFIARWGGDEFALVLPDGSGDFELRDAAQLLIAKLAQPVHLEGSHDARVSPSLGAVICPVDGTDGPTLLRKADSAMYAAKEAGRNCLRMFEPLIEETAVRRVRMQGLLRADAERNAFTFVAQPKVDRQGRPTGAEVLVRWNTREFGAVSPAEFIPLAEQSSTIELLGRHAMHMAAQLAAEVQACGFRIPVAVNLSPRQLRFNGFERLALRACEQAGVTPSQLELELTESALASDTVQLLLRRLRGLGFKLALDDFGTGYSSLSHLLHLPFHKVKIDRAFVKDLLDNARARSVIRGTLQICHDLGLTNVAEGVETREQFELLCELGVDEFQGYLFARPQPTEDWLTHLRRGAPAPDWMS